MSRHIVLYYWLCDIDKCAHNKNSFAPSLLPSQRSGNPQSPNPNLLGPPLPDGVWFNRKDLHASHLRRMHVPPHIVGRWKTNTPTDTEWNEHIKELQLKALRERCQLPDYMECPVPHCNMSFSSLTSWDEWMEHMAEHLEKADAGEESQVDFGNPTDSTLIAWATKPEVAIIRSTGPRAWVLNNPLWPVKPRKIKGKSTLLAQRSQTQQTRPEPRNMTKPAELVYEDWGEWEEIPGHHVGLRDDTSHDDHIQITSADINVPMEGPSSPVPASKQPVAETEGSLFHKFEETDLMIENVSDLPPRQYGTTGTAPTDFGYGTSVPPGSMISGLLKQVCSLGSA